MFLSSKKAYTLLEIMLVLTLLGMLITALTVSFSNYVKRGRDTVRITSLTNLSRALGNFYQDYEKYPIPSASGCLMDNRFATYVDPEVLGDPLAFHDNGCGENGRYGYGMSISGITSKPDEYVIISILETSNNGNYGGSIEGLTGELVQAGYSNVQTLNKGAGQYYIITK